jgi:hypothetical protein
MPREKNTNRPLATFPFFQTRERATLIGLALSLGLLLGFGVWRAVINNIAAAQHGSLTTSGVALTENFNTLSSTAGSTTNNLTITGWFMTETGGGARDNEQYAVDTGGSNTGDTYSYGTAGNADRALGGLQSGTLIPTFGACFTNNTGSTITSLNIAYTGEQWRSGNTAAARDDRLDFQYSTTATSLTTGTWTDVNALDFTNPIKTVTTAGALDGNAAANRTAISNTISSLSIANGATFWIRWNDLNASGSDDGLAVDDFSITPQGGPVVPALNISDVTMAEGDPPGTTTFTFAVTLTSAAGAGGVTFDIGTADNTATTADNDYVLNSLTGQSISAGSAGPYNFNVVVNRDTTTEPNETFFVNVTNVTGANVSDGQGQGTINNDDVAITLIHDIQGPDSSSPIVGASVSTRGIVTGVRGNGFFIQEPDASVDANPATSEGIFVFTSSAPPAAAVVGALVQVTATVVEFVPTQDPLQPPLSELSSPTVTQLSTGNPLPAAIPLSATFPDPAGTHDQLERLEGMRVSMASMTVGGPTQGNVNEPNATATSTGVFFGVVTGLPRAFREAGIQAPDPPPSGTIPPIPRFDTNPEVIRVDSDGLVGGPVIDVGTGAIVTGLIGPLDYGFRHYTILPDPGATIGVSGGPTATAVATPAADEFTVASYNLERFFDDVNDPGIGEPVLTTTAYNNRLAKASLGIRNFLKTPDIVGIVEVENLTTLQALAAKINNDAVAASQPNPMYTAHLVEGNDVGGIDVGFLVKTAIVTGATPRVMVNLVMQELDGTLFVNADSSTETLHDRPPLRLDATINHANGASFPVQVIVNHMRSLNGVNDIGPGSSGWATGGDRVRAKRLAQAKDLASFINTRQTANPTEHIILVGDFNFFEFNDGFVDSMSTVIGAPVPDNQTAVPGDGVDLVNPDLSVLLDTALQRYSFVFDGNAQSLDHAIINGQLISSTLARRVEHPRINADFPEIARNGTVSVERLADHDPLVVFFKVQSFATADLSVTKTDSPDPVTAGTNLTYTITVSNAGPDAATNASWNDTLPTGTTFVSLPTVAGWSCTTPAVGAGGMVSCTNPSFAAGSATFTLTVAVAPSVAAGTVLSNTATVTSTTADSNSMNNNVTATTTVAASANLSVTKADGTDPLFAGNNLSYTITVNNAGPSNAATVALSDLLPAGTTFVSLSSPGGWSCTTPAIGAAGTVSCTIASLAPGNAIFTLVVKVNVTGSVSNTATVTSTTTDPTTGNESGTATTTVNCQTITVTNPATTTGVFGTPFSATFTQTGGIGTTMFSVSPAIPGLTMSSGGVLSGTPTQVGTFMVTVTANDANNCPGTSSYTLTISKANTTTTINSDNPDPSTPGQTVTVAYTVTPVAPATGTPSLRAAAFAPAAALAGNVTVTASTGESCMGTVAAGSCTITFATGGARTLTAAYAGDANFNGSTSAPESHNVTAAAGYTGSFSDPVVCLGPGGATTGTVSITNPAPFSQTFSLDTTFTNYVGVPNTCVLTGAAAGATCVVSANGLTAGGSIPANTTLVVQYQAQVADVATGTTVTASNIATLGGVTLVPNPLVFTATVTCPAAGPGALTPASSAVSDQKPGSVLFYNLVSSSPTNAATQNARISLTNTHPSQTAYVHLFFVDGSSCTVADSFICLTPNQTATVLHSDIDPGVTGYLVAVATDRTGCPISFNYLIGDEFVKLASGHAANLAAESIAALPGGLPACNAASSDAVLRFDEVSYNAVPRVLALDNFASPADNNQTLLVVNRVGGFLSTGAFTTGTLFGLLYDDSEQALSFSLPGACQVRANVNGSGIRTTPRLEQFVPSGRTGWLKIYNNVNDFGLFGAALNFNANAGTQPGAFNQGHNLHKLRLSQAAVYTIPVFPPSC